MLSSVLLAIALVPVAQQAPVPDESKQFDFWVGDWDCSGKSLTDPVKNEWVETKGENHINRLLGGHVVHESFSGAGLTGQSWSVYNPRKKKWQQTWVDDQGSYIDLEGEFKDGKMTLVTLPNPNKPGARSRMVFSNIKPESFDWDWEGSKDDGKTWTLQWHLSYTRMKDRS